MFKHSYLKEVKPSPLCQKKAKVSNSILNQLRNHTYTTLAQGLFHCLSSQFIFYLWKVIIVLMSNAENYELLLEEMVAQIYMLL
jgi:hypothetical protein